MIGAPVFHVNGDDPEDCGWVAELAVDYRKRWHNDVVIDMLCCRRRGHNEGDDPSMIQPAMYDIINAKRGVIYTESLIGRGDISVDEAETGLEGFRPAAGPGLRRGPGLEANPPCASWSVASKQVVSADLDTSIPLEMIHRIGGRRELPSSPMSTAMEGRPANPEPRPADAGDGVTTMSARLLGIPPVKELRLRRCRVSPRSSSSAV